MNVVYFPRSITFLKGIYDEERLKPSVDFGIVDNLNEDRVIVTKYSMIRYFIDGIAENMFSEDSDWISLPAGYKRDKDVHKEYNLMMSRLNTTKPQEFYDFSKNAKINNPEDIVFAVQNCWLIESNFIDNFEFDVLIKDNTYKLVRKPKAWTTNYGSPPSSYFEYSKNLYTNYDDALTASKGIISDYYKKKEEDFLLDIESSIMWVLNKIPEGKKYECEFILRTLHYEPKFNLRFYNGEVLYKSGNSDRWEAIFTV